MATPSIYAIRNSINGHLYIGSSVDTDKRFRTHRRQLEMGKHHSRHLQRAYDKYGGGVFGYSVIEYLDTPERSVRLEREQVWISFFRPAYNVLLEAGSPRGIKQSEETKRKRSESLRGKKRAPFSPEHRARISAAKRGVRYSPEARARMGLGHLGNKSFLGRPFTEEHRRNLSRAKLGNANAKGFKYAPEAYASRRGPRKKVAS